MKNRIWELDVFRGICIIGVVFVHLMYDLSTLYKIIDWQYPVWFAFIKRWGGILFILLSGTCATLGRRSVRRGLVVLGCGMVISAVTYGMYRYGFHKSIIIYFGVLHCLGICMILWWIFKRFPTWLLAILGVAMVAAGLYLDTVYPVDHLWLMPLGLVPPSFSTSDYFPLLPNLGWFLLGAVMGRTIYRKKQTLLPFVSPKNPIVRFFSFLGRHSLWIYLLHQPILSGICMLLQ
jgi:uncharacterized membrane protein